MWCVFLSVHVFGVYVNDEMRPFAGGDHDDDDDDDDHSIQNSNNIIYSWTAGCLLPGTIYIMLAFIRICLLRLSICHSRVYSSIYVATTDIRLCTHAQHSAAAVNLYIHIQTYIRGIRSSRRGVVVAVLRLTAYIRAH